MKQYFTWAGEPIEDIEAWAKEHGEDMIGFRVTKTVPNLVTGQLDEESYEAEMPEYWYNNLSMSGGIYTTLYKRAPR